MAKSGSASGFWHCERCQTPNPSAAYLTSCIGCGAPRASAQVAQATRTSARAAQATVKPAPAPAGPEPEAHGTALVVATWGFVAVVLLVLVLTRWWGDLWWPGTVLLYMPRLPWLFPLVVLALWNLKHRFRSLWAIQGALALVILGPLMAFHLPWGSFLAGSLEGHPRLRILTLNRSIHQLDSDRLVKLLEEEQIDLICFQEGHGDKKMGDPILGDYLSRGWHWDQHGFLVSRLPIVGEGSPKRPKFSDPSYGFAGVRLGWLDLQMFDGTIIRLAGVHMPTVADGFMWLMRGELARMGQFQDWRRQQVSEILEQVVGDCPWPILLAGDFNTPPESPLMDPLRQVFRFGHEEAGFGYGYTRPAALPWIQIDQILATSEWSFTRCWVGPDVGSDHLPLIAEVALNPALALQRSDIGPANDQAAGP